MMNPMQGPPHALLGREAERERIIAFLDQRDVLPAALIIEGEAGAGKTTLWRNGIDAARDAGYRVLACRPAGAEVQLSFASLSDLLTGELDEVIATLPPPQRRALEIALLLRDDAGRAPDQRAIAAGVVGVLRALSHDALVLIAIDDAQWLDAPTVAVLEYALRRVGGAPVAVLAAVRTDETSTATAGRRIDLAHAVDGPVSHLPLGPLSLGAIQRLILTRTGLAFNRPTLKRIHETSGGNPFYALELAGALERGVEGWSPGEPLPLSLGLQELLADRHAGLGRRTRDALFVAAAGSQPTLDLIGAVIGADASEALRPAVEAGIVQIQRGLVSFSHPLLAASIYATTTPDRRERWHARLATTVTEAEARARHLALSRAKPDVEVAASLFDAARSARLRGALPTAAELFAEAIAWLPPSDAGRRATWTVEAAPTLRSAGDSRQARLLLEAAIADLPPGGERSDALLLLSGLVATDEGGSAREAELIGAALAEAGADPRRRAAALVRREMWERHRDRFAAALPVAREAANLAEQAGDDHLMARALTRVADLEVLLGLAPDPVPHFRRALDAGVGFRFDSRDDSAPSMLAACLIRAGRVDEARELLLGEHQRAVADGDDASLEIIDVFLTELEWLAGQWTRATTHAEEGLEIAARAESRTMHAALEGLLALVEASRGEIERARVRATSALAQAEAVGDRSYSLYARQILGFVELSGGDAAAARECHARDSIEEGIEGSKRLSFAGDAIEALISLGQVDEAATLTAELRRRGETLHRKNLTASADRGEALVLASRGALDAAIGAAVASIAAFESMHLPFELARSRLVLGAIERRAKRRANARTSLSQTIEEFEALGAPAWAERARSERARIGGRSAVEGLTETELRVAQLVGRGMSNKEIAAELFVTVRAVEANLSRIYTKLGMRSRTELAHRF
jgi:DNA-binding NarL/FixJ family response regulator